MATFDIDAKIVIRKRYYVVYIKEGSQIWISIPNVMESPSVTDGTGEHPHPRKDARKSINRQVNCETANINKNSVSRCEADRGISSLSATR